MSLALLLVGLGSKTAEDTVASTLIVSAPAGARSCGAMLVPWAGASAVMVQETPVSVDWRVAPTPLEAKSGALFGRMMAGVTFIAGARPEVGDVHRVDQILTGLHAGRTRQRDREVGFGAAHRARLAATRAARHAGGHRHILRAGRIGAGADFRLVTLTDR